MTDYLDALAGVTQLDLDACDPTFEGERGGVHAFLQIGRMHGVSIAFGCVLEERRELFRQVEQGVVLRFMIPHGTRLSWLEEGLRDGGSLAVLIDAVLEGHVLSLMRDSATGSLTPGAASAREALLELLGRQDAEIVAIDAWRERLPAPAAPELTLA